MALTVFNAICLAKWPWCEVDDDDSEICCDKGEDAMIAFGSEASEGCVDRLALAIWDAAQMLRSTASLSLCQV